MNFIKFLRIETKDQVDCFTAQRRMMKLFAVAVGSTDNLTREQTESIMSAVDSSRSYTIHSKRVRFDSSAKEQHVRNVFNIELFTIATSVDFRPDFMK